jgi:hypothetical protein
MPAQLHREMPAVIAAHDLRNPRIGGLAARFGPKRL